ncbi:hypothetical protein KM043_013982 [Ampulex compressa]|nr:hypothetical protein KM043_013982 [Ampulex compressa]
MWVTGESEETTKEVNEQIKKYLKIKDLGSTNYYLGTKIEQEPDESFLLNQKAKIIKLLKDHELLEPKVVAMPMEPEFLEVFREDFKELDNNGLYRKVMRRIYLLVSYSSGTKYKHIDVRYHYIRHLLDRKIIDVCYCPSDQMFADVLTKPLARNLICRRLARWIWLLVEPIVRRARVA